MGALKQSIHVNQIS